jgi:hypothetical protein
MALRSLVYKIQLYIPRINSKPLINLVAVNRNLRHNFSLAPATVHVSSFSCHCCSLYSYWPSEELSYCSQYAFSNLLFRDQSGTSRHVSLLFLWWCVITFSPTRGKGVFQWSTYIFSRYSFVNYFFSIVLMFLHRIF